jgi:hypothetical protein
LGAVGQVACRPDGVARCEASIPRRSGPANRSPEHHVRLLERGAAIEICTLIGIVHNVSDASRG